MLLQIHEPNQTPEPHESAQKIVLGIDLGTTNSVVAIAKNQTPHTLKIDGSTLIPSVVGYINETLVGQKALSLLKENPFCVVRSTKRLLGKSVHDNDDVLKQFNLIDSSPEDTIIQFKVGEKISNPIHIAGEILKYIKNQSMDQLGVPIDQAVITVPAYFDDNARSATRLAAKIAGLDVLRLINEPTAAAIAYGLDQKMSGCIAVYDLGGGTFDISILKCQQGVLQVIATGGDTSLGGDDFDHALAQNIKDICGIKNLTPDAHNLLLLKAREIKEHLSQHSSFVGKIGDKDYHITQDAFEKLIVPIIQKTHDIMARVLEDAGIKITTVKDVVLVGGATRMPSIQKTVATFFKQPPLCTLNPDEVVALGAALQAETLATGSGQLLLDVTPLSLGLETMGEIVEKIIPRNTPIPCRMAQEFTTHQNNQTAMRIHVLQGEREFAKDCRSLGFFSFKNIPPMPAGMAKIQVTFAVDADGLLTVSATEKTTGKIQQIDIKPSYGLTIEQVEAMLKDSYIHGTEDIKKRLCAQSREKLHHTILALKNALDTDGHLITSEEKKQLEDFCTQASHISDDKEAIDTLQEKISNATQSFAQKRIESALTSQKI